MPLCHEKRGNASYSSAAGRFYARRYRVSGSIYQHKGTFVLGGRLVFFSFLRAVPRACCLRPTPLGYYCRERQRGMCLGSVGSGLDPRQPHRWPESQSLFLSLAILFSSARGPPPLHHLQMKTFPLVSRAEGRICHCVLEECIKRALMCL